MLIIFNTGLFSDVTEFELKFKTLVHILRYFYDIDSNIQNNSNWNFNSQLYA